MGNPLFEVAVKGLEAIGIPIAGMEFLVESLFNEGADIVTEIPKLFNIVAQFGGHGPSVLAEISSGMATYGPQGYVQHLLHQKFDPAIQTVRDISNSKKSLSDTHRTMLTNVNTQMTTLFSGATPYTGLAATQLDTSYTQVSSDISRLVDYMDQSHQIDQDFFTQVEAALIVGGVIMLLTLICIAIVMLLEAVLAILSAPETVGVGLLAGGAAEGLTIGGAIGILGEEAQAILAAIIVCFLIWALRHAILNIQYHVAFAKATPTSKKVYDNPKPSKAQQDAIDQLLNELGPGVSEAWIKYLVTLLGTAGLSINQVMDIIRCLNNRGWLQPGTTGAPWDDDYRKAWNIITGQLRPDDIQASWYDMRGIPVVDKTGKVWPSHLTKVSDGLRSLQNMLNDSKLSKGFKDALRKLIQWVDDKIMGDEDPTTWTDEGRSNFWKDVIANSGCLKSVTGKSSF